MRIGVLVDSACDLPKSFLDENGVVIMPIAVRIGDYLIEDRRDPAETLAFYEAHLDRKSDNFAESMPFPPEQIEALFLERLVLDFDYVFCLTITAARSKIYDNSMDASRSVLTKYKQARTKAGLPERFGLAVLSSRNMFTGQAVQAAEAIRLIKQGATPREVGARLNDLVDKTHAYVIPADLYHIHKRASKRGDKSVGWGSYMIGSMLDVKPILYCHMDDTGPVAKVRGFETAATKLFAVTVAAIRGGLEAPIVSVSYGGHLEKLKTMNGFAELSRVAAEHKVELLLSLMSTTAAVNVGPGALSVAFISASKPEL